MSSIKEQLKNLPAAPGVYKFLDKNKKILYIGKAALLKSRVGSYFLLSQRKLGSRRIKSERELDSRLRGNDRKSIMISQIHKIETIETDSVLEALILEANLIKKNQPRFNVKLKDDKSFVNIVVTNEEYPSIQVVRSTDKGTGFRGNHGMTYGPFPSAKMAKDAVDILQKIFLFRSCKKLPNKKCLIYDIKQCSAPCIKKVLQDEYKKTIKNLILFLQGKKKNVIKNFEREMAVEAKKENFERAAELRNQIFSLKHIKDISLIKKEGTYKNTPHRIEAYDISNISGKMATGSMVVFVDGKVASDEYRKFKIKSVHSANDAAMIKEILRRRLCRKEWPYPDLIIVDGGKPQYRAICDVMSAFAKRFGETTGEAKFMIPVIAIAKGPTRKKADLIFSQNASRLDINLIKQLRDEAHRFAIKYHRKLRGKF